MVYFAASTTNLNMEKLREQLDHLHKEAQSTRNKTPGYSANNARSRLLRLSEAAEKFRRQAAISVRTGKENDARELLSKERRLCKPWRIQRAISEEKQLIGNVALDLEITKDDAPSPIRIVSPKDENPDNSDEIEDFDQEIIKLDDSQELQAPVMNQMISWPLKHPFEPAHVIRPRAETILTSSSNS
ncbi:hypothetical protein HAX54_041770 [Datura stramonium]|uniref:Uncharacterized protein n=1 Tax=Datura stramonium TaxID=4076 RepID=A0ABS8VXV4_DATST|nr:hypothetical protein [Datura stramonium]